MSEGFESDEKRAALRRAFDAAFAEPPEATRGATEDVLTIRVADDPYAVRLREVASLVRRSAIVPLPAAGPSLLGVAGVRGALIPVFSLATLLGYDEGREAPGWMIICGKQHPVALAFAALEACVRVPVASIFRSNDAAVRRPFVTDLAQTDTGVRLVVDVAAILESVSARSVGERSSKEK